MGTTFCLVGALHSADLSCRGPWHRSWLTLQFLGDFYHDNLITLAIGVMILVHTDAAIFDTTLSHLLGLRFNLNFGWLLISHWLWCDDFGPHWWNNFNSPWSHLFELRFNFFELCRLLTQWGSEYWASFPSRWLGLYLQRDGLYQFLGASYRGTVCILGLTLLQTASTESRVSVEQMFCKIKNIWAVFCSPFVSLCPREFNAHHTINQRWP